MQIRAPESTWWNLSATAESTKFGDVLFVGDTMGVDAERAKVAVARQLLDQAQTGLEPSGAYEKIKAAKKEISTRGQDLVTTQTLLRDGRKVAFEAGVTTQEPYENANYLLADASAIYAEAFLDEARTGATIEQMRGLAPVLRGLQELAEQQLAARRERLIIRVTAKGSLLLSKPHSGWYDQGQVMATSLTAYADTPSTIVEAPIAGVLALHASEDGSMVVAGATVGTIDDLEERAQIQRLVLLSKQLDAIEANLTGPLDAAIAAARSSRIQAVLARNNLQRFRLGEARKMEEAGAVTHLDYVAAAGAFASAEMDRTRSEIDLSTQDLIVGAARNNLPLYRKLVDIQLAAVAAERRKKTLVAPRPGRLLWMVAVGSYVDGGTPIFGIC